MENNPEVRLHTEKYFRKICQIISEYRYVILGSLIAGFLAYTYMFTNKFPNHDDLRALFSKGTTFASGRWGLWLLSFIFPNISMPWIFGVLSLLFLTVGNCLIVRIFGIKSPVLQVLLGGMIITFPSQTGTFGYMFTACAYAVSFCLAVLVTYFLCNGKKQYVAAILCEIFSLSIYQAYLSVTVSILVLFLIYRMLTEEENAKNIFFRGGWFVAFLIASLGLYWIVTKGIWVISGTRLGSYASNAISFSVTAIPSGIKNAYKNFFKILFFGYAGLIPSVFLRVLHFLCLILAGIECLSFILRRKDWKQTALLLFLLAILPMAINSMFLLIAAQAIHTLVLYSFIAIYILLAIFVEYGQYRSIKTACMNWVHMLCLDCIVLSMAVILLCNVYTANAAALKMQLTYENTYAFSVSVATQLQSEPGYTTDSKVAILGTYDTPDFLKTHFSNVGNLMGTHGISPTTYSIGDFFAYYIGRELNWASQKECEALMQTAEFAQMQSYPNYGCVKQIGDVFVIKISP